jgi:hypothetical protein
VDSVHGHPGRRSRNWRLPVALAASLLVAVLAGMRIGSRDSTGDRFDTLVAVGQVPVASSLAQALEHVASDHSQVADPQSGLRITPQLSFVSAREGVCREFRLDAAERAARGLACRNEGGWRTLRVTAAAVRSGGGDGFETASIDGDTGFDAFVDALIDTAPLGPEEETRLMQNGWRPD